MGNFEFLNVDLKPPASLLINLARNLGRIVFLCQRRIARVLRSVLGSPTFLAVAVSP